MKKRSSPSEKPARSKAGAKQIARVRKLCLSLPGSAEKLSHGEPTFFTNKKVFVMFANNHHHDGHVAVWLPVAEGARDELVRDDPQKFYVPPYVGVKGWIGIELSAVSDDELGFYVCEAHRLVIAKKPRTLRSV